MRNLVSSALALAWSLGSQAQVVGVVEYYHLDGLGSVRAVTNAAGAVIERHDYQPFGEEHLPGQLCPPGSPSPTCQTREFTGKERDAETGYDYFGARYYPAKNGRLSTVDPLQTVGLNLVDPQRWNRYAYANNNPTSWIDPDGRSTIANDDGKVTAVNEDKDNGVYRNGTRVGETEYWDEFRAHDDDTGEILPEVMQDARIDFGSSWDPAIRYSNEIARGMLPSEVAQKERTGQFFDIKNDLLVAPYGHGTGRLLNGKYATAKSAGNYLAGLNMATVTWPGGLGIDHDSGMRLAGMLARKKFGYFNAWRVLALGHAFGPGPWYGENEYAGRRIHAGYAAGMN